MVGNKITGKGKEVTPERRVEGSDDMIFVFLVTIKGVLSFDTQR